MAKGHPWVPPPWVTVARVGVARFLNEALGGRPRRGGVPPGVALGPSPGRVTRRVTQRVTCRLSPAQQPLRRAGGRLRGPAAGQAGRPEVLRGQCPPRPQVSPPDPRCPQGVAEQPPLPSTCPQATLAASPSVPSLSPRVPQVSLQLSRVSPCVPPVSPGALLSHPYVPGSRGPLCTVCRVPEPALSVPPMALNCPRVFSWVS